jgi:hypothetical protein
MQEQGEREAHLRALADRLEFTVEKAGDRFKLTRTSDVSCPVYERSSLSRKRKSCSLPGSCAAFREVEAGCD